MTAWLIYGPVSTFIAPRLITYGLVRQGETKIKRAILPACNWDNPLFLMYHYFLSRRCGREINVRQKVEGTSNYDLNLMIRFCLHNWNCGRPTGERRPTDGHLEDRIKINQTKIIRRMRYWYLLPF